LRRLAAVLGGVSLLKYAKFMEKSRDASTYPSRREPQGFGHLWGLMAATSGKESLLVTLLSNYVEVLTALVMTEQASAHPQG
jgi:hypothetical protein